MALPGFCDCGRFLSPADMVAGGRMRCPGCGREGPIPSPAIVRIERESDPYFGGVVTEVEPEGAGGTGIGGHVKGILLILGCVVVAVGLLLPAVSRPGYPARRAQCSNNLKQIGLALYNIHDATGHCPPAAIIKDGRALLSWRVAILPYLEQRALYTEFHLDEPWDSPHNKALLPRMPAVYACPSDRVASPATGLTTYRVLVGPGTLFEGAEGVKLDDVTDGTATTLAVVESPLAVPWTKPEELAYDPRGPLPPFGSEHRDGFKALFADGSVRSIPSATADLALRRLITRNGGEAISLDR